MSNQQAAIEHCLSHPLILRLLGPHYFPANGGMIRWQDLNYGPLSGGEKAAISWVYAIWCDVSPNIPSEQITWRDCFEGFATMQSDLQITLLEAFQIRHEIKSIYDTVRG